MGARSFTSRTAVISTAPAGSGRSRRAPGSDAREIHYEETNWRARPDLSPDGSRLVYASYLGRNWHQLWLTPAGGGDAFPISYGEFRRGGAALVPRRAHDRLHLEPSGGLELWLHTVAGGAERPLP